MVSNPRAPYLAQLHFYINVIGLIE